MRRQPTRVAAVVAALALTLWGCGGGEGDSAAPAGSAASEAAGEATEQANNLVQAFQDDPQELGLDPIEPPDYAQEIRTVDTSQYALEGNPRIAFAIQAPEFSWPVTYNEAVQAHQQEAYPDAELILSPTGLGEADTQIAAIEDLLVQQPDALIITPLTDVRGPVEQAAAEGVPVILCTGTAETDAYVTRVDRDNFLNGALGASWVVEKLGGQGQIVMLSGPAGVPTAEARIEGAMSVFEQNPDIEVLAQENTNWDAASGKTVMQSMLTRFDQIDAVWSDGAGQAIGAIEAFKDAGREIPPFAAEPQNGFLRLADEEGFEFVAVGYPPSHSADCLDAAMEVLSGEPVPSFINVEVPLFDTEELGEWYRPECVDDLWLPTPFSDEELVGQELCES